MKQHKSGFPKILHWNASNLIPKMIQSKRARQNYEPEPTPTSSRTSFSNRNWRVRELKVNAILHCSNTWLTSFMPELDSFCRVFWRPNPRTIIQMKGESEVSIQEKSLSCKKRRNISRVMPTHASDQVAVLRQNVHMQQGLEALAATTPKTHSSLCTVITLLVTKLRASSK